MVDSNRLMTKALFLTMVTVILYSCDSPEKAIINDSNQVENTSTVVLSIEQFESSAMELASITKHVFHNSIKCYGIFDVPPENKASISAYFGGYVKKLSLLEGQNVKNGDILFTLENPEYVVIQQEFLEAKSQLSYLKLDYERQKNLLEDNVTSKKVYLKAESDYRITLVRYESMKKKLELMNLNPSVLSASTIQSEINITSPLSGSIASVNATKGMYLNPDDIALTIINSDHMHLELSIFEKDLPLIKINQEIRFKLQNDSQKEYEAYVYLVSNFIDPEKRNASIHGHLIDESESSSFSPGMYIEAEIYSSNDTLLAIQQSAVIKTDVSQFVLVKIAESDSSISFEKRRVQIGESKNGYSQIINSDDFKKDDLLLVNGAFNLIGN
jgi:cobalt-zinc-cadmium efflux system membrane fusion protein